MLRCVSSWLVAGLVMLVTAGVSVAAERPPADPSPFAHAPCSVLDSGPCTPSVCSPLDHGPCNPEIDYPIGENLQVTVESKPAEKDTAKYQKPDHDLDTIGDLFRALRSCWTPPPEDAAQADMQMAVKFSFKRDGALIAPPQLTYATPSVSSDTRNAYRQAIDESLAHCAPLSFSQGFGGAIAGRPILIRYVDNRTLGRPAQP
ncbi:hypothetical protein [Bradyrhizobium prioriisuperbiae]|uniref:hypothetical protein n=1 Tax=Bradyrhizobium prioriisuperbiae TaxID=2854389 RepID=UPI0038991D96